MHSEPSFPHGSVREVWWPCVCLCHGLKSRKRYSRNVSLDCSIEAYCTGTGTLHVSQFVRVFVEDGSCTKQGCPEEDCGNCLNSKDTLKKSEVLAERKSAVLNENVFSLHPSTRPKFRLFFP